MTTLYIVRHGETDLNRLYRFIGSTDHPLNERGIAQVETLREPMSKFHLDRIYSSPLKRTMMTAERIQNGRDIEIVPVGDLKDRGKVAGRDRALGKEARPSPYGGRRDLRAGPGARDPRHH